MTFRTTTLEHQLLRANAGAVTRWLVDGILVEHGSNMIYAPPGCGKSLVALDLALAASEGRSWLNAYPVAQQSVLLVDEDGNNDHELNGRLLKFRAIPNGKLRFALRNGFQITDEKQCEEMVALCREHDVRLIIFDSLTRLHRLQEGSASEMKLVNAAIKSFTMVGVTVVMLHHSSKRGSSTRGSGEIDAGFDAIYRLERVNGDSFRMINMKTRSVGENGVWYGCNIAVETDEDGRLTLNGADALEDSDSDGDPKVAMIEEKEKNFLAVQNPLMG